MNFRLPIRLTNSVQNYAWGTRNQEAFIARLLGIPPEADLPYAELWVGAHHKAPSRVDGKGLDEITAKYSLEILGQKCAEKFDHKFPFLFKVLSAGEALSIQAHPDKKQAELLHQMDPTNYPDANHKPEIAIALDKLIALAGFPGYEDLRRILRKYPEMMMFIGEPAHQLINAKPNHLSEKRKLIYAGYIALMKNAVSAPDHLAKYLSLLEKRLISQQNSTDLQENLFLKLRQKYQNDVGLFSLFYLKLIQLTAGEAIFLPAGIPHAYLQGNIIECMANSDNVVRAGLTPKFVDIANLIAILNPKISEIAKMGFDHNAAIYDYEQHAEEFKISRIHLREGQKINFVERNNPGVFICINGKFKLTHFQDSPGTVFEAGRGEVYLLPAACSHFILTGQEDSLGYLAEAPLD